MQKSEEIIISQMKFDDLVEVYNLGNKLFTSDKWPNLYRSWDEFEIMERYISDEEFCLVAKYKKKVVGFALAAIIEKKKNSWTYGYLAWTGVDTKFAGLGIGRRLLKRITKLFKEAGVKILLVDTSTENKKALGFFIKNGFVAEEGHIYLSKNISK